MTFALNDLERIINSVSDPIFVKNRDHVWILLNDAYCRFMGFKREELIGKSDRDFFPKDEADVFWAKDEVVFESGIENINDEEFTDSAGAKHFITTKKSLYQNASGDKFIVGCIRDLTDLRNTQKQLQEARDRLDETVQERTAELAASNEALRQQIIENERTAEQLRQSQKMEAVGRLAGGIAHDFNNLLNIIIGYTSILESSVGSDPAASRCTGQITAAAERAASLTRQLLAFSRKQVLNPEILNIDEILANMGKLLPSLLGEDVELVIRSKAKKACVKADRSQIEQVIMNLAVNARDAMPHGGKLTIETKNVELDHDVSGQRTFPLEYLMLTVTDTGEGMDAGTQAHMFEPFFTTKGAGKGTGLGLATVYAVVMQNNGDIKVESEVGRGTNVSVLFPCSAAGEWVPDPPEAPPVADRRGTETILLVEDEDSLRKLLCSVLEAQGYKVMEAESGAAALEMAARIEGGIDLLVTDIVMPGMRGWEVAGRLKSEYPALRVLYISGHTDPGLSGNSVEVPSDSLLQKPFRPRELLSKISAMLAHST